MPSPQDTSDPPCCTASHRAEVGSVAASPATGPLAQACWDVLKGYKAGLSPLDAAMLDRLVRLGDLIAAILADAARLTLAFGALRQVQLAFDSAENRDAERPATGHGCVAGGVPDAGAAVARSVMTVLGEQLPLFGGCQRWRQGREHYRPAGEPFEPTRYSVEPIDFRLSRQFVTQHHYSGTMPAARLQLGLRHKASAFQTDTLAGVLVFSVPVQEQAVPAWLGLVVGLTIECYGRRYCYEGPDDAREALQGWDGVGHPAGP